MNNYALAYLLLLTLSLGLNLAEHGKECKGKNNFWITLASVLIQLFLLYKAGLFN